MFALSYMTNLLPQEIQQALKHEYRRRLFAVVLFAVAGIFLSGAAFLVPSYVGARGRISALAGRLQVVASPAEEGSEDESYALALTQAAAELSTLETAARGASTGTRVERIVEHAGQDIVFSTIVFVTEDAGKGWRITIEGVARSREALIALERRLRQAEGVTSVTIPLEHFAANRNITFTAIITGREVDL